MKKWLSVCLAAVLLLTACAGADPGRQTVSAGTTGSDHPGVSVRIVDAVWDDGGLRLVVDWVNTTGWEAVYGASYRIERKDGDTWVSCAKTEDIGFIAIAYILSAGQTNRETYGVSALFDVSRAGTYRFLADYSLSDGSGGADGPLWLWAEFTLGAQAHGHTAAAQSQTVEDPITGYCGNTWTTIHQGEKEYSFQYGQSITLTNILVNLEYDPDMVCRCIPEFTVNTEFGTGYGVNLSQAYARCEKGQASLTQEQIDTIAGILEWAKTTGGEYPLETVLPKED